MATRDRPSAGRGRTGLAVLQPAPDEISDGHALPEPPAERRDAAENRARILACARQMLHADPLASLCMDEVARCAGVGKGTLYRRFADKTALLLALIDADERALQEHVRKAYAQDARAPHTRLLRHFTLLAQFVIDHAAFLEAAERHAHRSPRSDAEPARWRRRLLADDVAAALQLDAAAADDVAALLLAFIAGDRIARALSSAPPPAVLERTVRYGDALLRGLGTDPSPRT